MRTALTARRIAYAIIGVVVIFAVSVSVVALQTRSNPLPQKLARESENTKNNIVVDVTGLYPIKVQGIIVPHTIDEIVQAVKLNDHVSIGGGRNSMGGQTASSRAVQIDMREYNKVLDLSTTTKEITVQAGIRWYDVQKYIDPYNLSVKIMQTYSNFTVGGSLSVNVHGRYVGLGPFVMSVKSFRIVLADGSVINATPTEHSDIFYSAIGGLGGIGVVSDVTLELADNVNVERSRTVIPTSEYAVFFADNVRSNPNVIFHNGDMYPPDFTHVSAVSWSITDKAPTVTDRLIPKSTDYWLERFAWVVMSDWPGGRWIREHIFEPLIYRGPPPVHTRNYEASYDIAELEPESRDTSTYVLQEYFVPVENFDQWVPKMKSVFDRYDVNVLNVSIRHAKQDPGVVLAWAPKESFAFVVYYKQGTDDASKQAAAQWTRAMIDQVLTVGGTYYLPYQPAATDDQFHRAYPGAITYFQIKKYYDPTDKFTNNLWDTYYSPEKLDLYAQKQKELEVASTTPDYYRPSDNMYLSLPEWYIVYTADEYAAVLRDSLPSHFPYFGAHQEYWREYHAVDSRTATSTAYAPDYKTVLKVIGVSFSAENIVKGVYENTIGRATEFLAGNKQVPEDTYAAQVAQQYADYIYDYPWYDFSFGSSFKGLWTLRSAEHYSIGQDIRRIERKIFLSFEYGIKAGYSSVIAFASHTKFGSKGEEVYAVITRDGSTYELIHAAHYQPFTRLLLSEIQKESSNDRFAVLNIAGNDRILLTYRDVVGTASVSGTEVERHQQIDTLVDGVVHYKDRITVEVALADLPLVYKDLVLKGIQIDHIYDY
ncbi:MAG: FAD-binding oxidoreductase [Candidatus Kaiserbacteria bacterium]|nr:FAD-binding oxidoreductase [Candidatus Kaiserbacteria bacterium]